ncbi:amidase family protein [Streptomyces sp. NPDC059477]|uniref:amidase family protein n=1 Tax=Streptomyces sp. NPDC059477 TaxID=3346847 RepID=UPI0036820B40
MTTRAPTATGGGTLGGDEELCWWPALKAAKAIAAREVSAREHLAALLDAVAQRNPGLGLVVTLCEDAMSAAKEADALTARGELLPPLHGVPMTVKDCFSTAGTRTTGGTATLSAHVPVRDADAVAALRRAGCVVFGKTNLPEHSADVQTHSDLFGTARNPWDPAFSTGGSSGGSAGAVAAGLTPVELGSDVAGSIRLPASHCGVFGHRPSFRTVSTYGHVPPAPFAHTVTDLTVAGPFARTVDDLVAVFDAVAGPDSRDAPAWRLDLPPARRVRRVAAWFDDAYCPVDGEVRRLLEQAAGRLAGAGVPVEQVAPRGIRLDTSDRVFRALLTPVAFSTYSVRDVDTIVHGDAVPGAELGAEHVALSHRSWAEADAHRARLRLRWRAFFEMYDAILLPVAPTAAPPHDHRPFAERDIQVDGRSRPYWDQLTWAGLTGVCHLPTTVVPVGLTRLGLPVGMAVAGPYLGDRTTLALAKTLEQVLPPLGRPPVLAPHSRPTSGKAGEHVPRHAPHH